MPTTCVSSSLRMGIMVQHPLKRLRMSCMQAPHQSWGMLSGSSRALSCLLLEAQITLGPRVWVHLNASHIPLECF